MFSSSLSGGVLSIVGTGSADRIFVYKQSQTLIAVEENDVKKTFPLVSVSRIDLDAKAGNDLVEISRSLTQSTRVWGNTGADTLTGGGGKDTIYGNEGNDRLADTAGGAVLRGNENADTLRGGSGVDAIFGDAGDDNLEGGGESDYLDGGSGYDRVDYSARTTGVRAGIVWSVVNQDGYYEILPGDTVRLITTGSGGTLDRSELDTYAGVEALSGSSAADTLRTQFKDEYRSSAPDVALAAAVRALATLRLDGNGGNDALAADYFYDNEYRIPTIGYGHAGNDSFGGDDGPGAITFYGGSGNDTASAGEEDRLTFYGEDGNDSARVSSSSLTGDITFFGGAGTDTYDTNYLEADYTLPPDLENFTTSGGVFPDFANITGNDLPNVIRIGFGGWGTIDTKGGDDQVIAIPFEERGVTDEVSALAVLTGDGNDTVKMSVGFLSTGAGDDKVDYHPLDVLEGESPVRNVELGSGDDALIRYANYNSVQQIRIHGEAGNDKISGEEGKETLFGGSGDDVLIGWAGPEGAGDVLYGGDGDDSLIGTASVDALFGNAGRDTLDAGAGDDYLDGGEDADVLIGGLGADKLYGFGGNDTLYQGFDAADTADGAVDLLDGGSGTDKARREAGLDSVLSIESFI